MNNLKYDIKWHPNKGFSKELSGLLPLLYINISKKGFKDMITVSNTSNRVSDALVKTVIETIDTGYNQHKNGIKKTQQLATYLMCQYKQGIIPLSNLKWCKNIKPINKLVMTIKKSK
jgi:hypothetical protein